MPGPAQTTRYMINKLVAEVSRQGRLPDQFMPLTWEFSGSRVGRPRSPAAHASLTPP